MSAVLHRWRHRTAHRLVTALSTRPSLYYAARRATGTFDDLCVRRDTELVVEGFPRSANSTTVYGILDRQTRRVRIAHHKHHAAQLIMAVRWGIPAMALIRPPREAVVGVSAHAEDARLRRGSSGRYHSLTFEAISFAYLAFYRAVVPYRNALVVAPFHLVTSDLDNFIQRLNHRFGTNFETGQCSADTPRNLGPHARPTTQRDALKSQHETALDAALTRSGRLCQLMEACDKVHSDMISGR